MSSRFMAAGLFVVVAFVTNANLDHDRYQSQDPPHTPSGPDKRERAFAVDLVRAVNTAEMTYRDQNSGSFASWDILASSRGFKQAIDGFSRSSPKLRDLNLNTPSNPVADWRLRLVVAPDNKSYVIVLLNTSDKECSYAVVSDEEGLVREAKAIGCSER